MFITFAYFACVYIRRRLNARIAELEDAVAQAQARASKLEKDKNRLSIEIREITVELETVSNKSDRTIMIKDVVLL